MTIAETIKKKIADKYFTFICNYHSLTSGIDRFGISNSQTITSYEFNCLQVQDTKGNGAEFTFTANDLFRIQEIEVDINKGNS